jgi:hypothetical protein
VTRHAAAFLLFWVALWWLWQLLVAEWGRYEWVAGAIAATVGAAVAEVAVTRVRARAPFPWAIVRSAPAALGMVFVDFATCMHVLATLREGVFRTTPFEYPDDVPHRTWAMVVADYSPNAYVVDISGGESLTHHLVPRKASQEPA